MYVRGAMVLQALRNKLGNERFFTLLQDWAVKGPNGSIPQFVRAAEQAAGYQMDRFFDVGCSGPSARPGPQPTASSTRGGS